MLTKLTIIIRINSFVKIVNFRNRFDKALMEIFQVCRALIGTYRYQYQDLSVFIMNCSIICSAIPVFHFQSFLLSKLKNWYLINPEFSLF